MSQSNHNISSSTDAVFDNDDLITEILLRVPAKSVLKFKLVSKKWLSIISESSFPIRHSRMHPHTISALLLKVSYHFKQPPHYLCVSTDRKSSGYLSYNFLNFDPNNPGNPSVSQTCNGLLLCSKWIGSTTAEKSVQPRDYIFNPTTRQFVMLPQLPDREILFERIRLLVFDPSRSPSYRFVCTQLSWSVLRIHVYSPKTKAWRLCVDQENFDFSRVNFDNGVFWNDAVHWMSPNGNGFCFSFDKECLQATPRVPLPENWVSNFGYFGESGGYLFFIGFLAGTQNPDDLNMSIISPDSSPDQITDRSIVVYAMERGCSKWFVKYCLHLNAIVMAYHEITEDAGNFSACSVEQSVRVLSFIEGNNGTGPLMVMRIPGGIITYNFKDKTFNKIFNFASSRIACCEAFTHSETLSWI